MRRREFLWIASATSAWPLMVRAQQSGAGYRRLGVLAAAAAGDPTVQGRMAALWMLFVGVMTWQTWPVVAKASRETVDAKPPFDPTRPFTDAATGQTWPDAWTLYEAQRRDAVVKGASMAIAPPLAVFILGMSLVWVARGFRQKSAS